MNSAPLNCQPSPGTGGKRYGPNLVAGSYADVLGYPVVSVVTVPGARYRYAAGNEDYCRSLLPPGGVAILPGNFTAPGVAALLVKGGGVGVAATAIIQRIL